MRPLLALTQTCICYFHAFYFSHLTSPRDKFIWNCWYTEMELWPKTRTNSSRTGQPERKIGYLKTIIKPIPIIIQVCLQRGKMNTRNMTMPQHIGFERHQRCVAEDTSRQGDIFGQEKPDCLRFSTLLEVAATAQVLIQHWLQSKLSPQ